MTTLCLCDLSNEYLERVMNVEHCKGWKRWESLPGSYVDPEEQRQRQFAQSERTVGGVVAEFESVNQLGDAI